MKKVLSLTSLFILILIAAVELRDRHTNHCVTDSLELKKKESGIKKLSDSPMEFIKFHQGIRTRSDERRPSYPANYQWAELQKAQLSSAYKKTTNLSARTQSTANGVSSFVERGPGNVPGRTRGLIVDPDDPTNKTWYAGSASGGVWKTVNAGNTWQWLTPSISNMATTTLAMAASNHKTIFAGTGEGFGNIDGLTGNGIFKSLDRGASWSLLTSSSGFGPINRIAVDPNNENNVLAVSNSGIYRSTDGGATWTQTFQVTDGVSFVQDLRPTPGNFSILYAGQNGVGVLKSIDGGVTWNLSKKGMAPNGRIEIAIAPTNTSRIAASVQGSLSGANSDLYLSNDGGATWYLVTLSLSGKTVDYLASSAGDQGWYDNTVAFSPYNPNVIYVGGVSAFQATLTAPTTSTATAYFIQENNTTSFLNLTKFNSTKAGGKLDIGSGVNPDTVQVRFGPGLSQKAHRFLVPAGATSGVPSTSYSYQDYVNVPFQIWDLHTNQQLMISFRDQNRNGVFDLIHTNTTSTDATLQSREYIFINNIPYNAAVPSDSIAKASGGGQAYQEMYFFWPVLASGATWSPNSLPVSNLQITSTTINKFTSTVSTVADPYSAYDGKNTRSFVHPDQHNIYPMANSTGQTFQLLLANDGGVFLSGTSASPGTTQGEWSKVGNGYNTSQFYGADKKPGAQEYLGGTQDNSVYFTPGGTVSSLSTNFNLVSQLAGDGFEVVWHSQDPNKLIGSNQNCYFYRSLDGGTTWTAAFTGLTLSGSQPDPTKFPFISKLASSKQAPDILYTVGSEGVWKSSDFGGNWALTPIATGWGTSTSFADVEVSRANANVLWAGSGWLSGGNLFVSTNAGQAFTAVPNPSGFTLGNISRIATHPTNEKIAYALFSYAKTAKILMTQDRGQTWTDISGFGTGSSSTTGFPDVAVYSLYVRPDNPNIIWAGTEIGIVESLDGGATWALLTEFPAVAVWDMKGQDNEVVIATHGRGIWTAELTTDQNSNFPVPVIMNSGTSPQSKFVVQVQLPILYDSVRLVINSQSLKFIPTVTGVQNIQIANVPKGSVSVQLIGYKGTAPIYSTVGTGINLSLLAYQQQYYDYFISTNNFYLNGMSLQTWGASNSSMQSSHNYASNQDATGLLLVPIVVSSGANTSISYQDVAIVVPGTTGSAFGQTAFNDYVVTEGTKDGITWIPIANGYNATANPTWLSNYQGTQSGTIAMTVTETVDLKNKFNPTDTLLIRFRLHATKEAATAWGWSVDNLYIQQTPTGVEIPTALDTFSAYPNPTSGKFTINFDLPNKSNVALNVWDMTGRSVVRQDLGIQDEGSHEVNLNLESAQDGIYLVRIKTNQGEKITKILVRK